jgi:ABC-type multidrug transport system ATPase subunit
MARAQSLFWSQSRGLLVRSWHYQRRQWCANVCNFLLPPLFLVLLVGLDKVLKSKVKTVEDFQQRPLGGYVAAPFEADQCKDLIRELKDGGKVRAACEADPFQNKYTVPYYAPDGSDAVVGGRDAAKRAASGLLGGLSLSPFIYPESLPGANSSFSKSQTWYDGVFLNEYGDMDRENVVYKAFTAVEARGLMDEKYETKTRRLGSKSELLSFIFDSWFTGGSFNPYKTAYGFNRLSGDGKTALSADVTVYYNESEQTGNCTTTCQVFSAVQRLDAAIFATQNPGKSAAAYLRRMPDTGYEEGVNFVSLVVSIVIALLLHFFIPFFTGFLVYERQTRLRELMATSGMRAATYWFTTYMSLLAQYGITAVLITIVGAAVRVPFFRLNEFPTYAILFFIWGHLVVAHAIFLAPFFGTAESAVVLCWLFVILTNFVGGPYIGTLLSRRGETGEGFWSLVMLLPSFSLMRSVYFAGAFNTGGQGITVGQASYQGTSLQMCTDRAPFCRSFLFLAVEWVVLMVLGLYFDQVLPNSTGVRKHPLFFLGRRRGRGRAAAKLEGAAGGENDLEDVAAERALVGQILGDDPSASRGVVVDGLHKVYHSKPPVHALRGMSLVARQGEITGLIGSNGAAKTTMTRILTGALDPTAGDAYLNGRSVRTQLAEIHQNLGICLQQDIQWQDLSVQEHLYFFGRLRNLPKRELKGAVARALEAVDLTFARRRKSGQCSGGMRRRLSVAIALLGDPEIVLLDEMSTGLDPATTETVWRAIQVAKPGKTIMITTHSMEEAKVLCDRVHMVTRGQLRCCGNPEELRLRLGRGYRLAASVPEAKVAGFHDMMMAISPDCRVETELGGSLNYSIPKSVALSTIFDAVGANKARLGIRDWGISQSSLEDVFLKVVSRDEAEVGVTKIVGAEDNA